MITIVGLDALSNRDLNAVIHRLTHEGSEFNQEASEVLSGRASSSTPMALCHLEGVLVGWACSHVWRDMQTLEQFVDVRYRRRGIASTLTVAMSSYGVIDRNQPVAVFSEATADIARRLWVADVLHYEHDGSDWVRV